MTADEKKALEKRLELANQIERRVAYLKDALKRLSNKDVEVIQIPLLAGQLAYRAKDSDRFSGVCWANDESGLCQEIFKAVCDIITDRLGNAQAELEKV